MTLKLNHACLFLMMTIPAICSAAPVTRFAADISSSQWIVIENQHDCELKHTIPQWGDAKWSVSDQSQLQMSFIPKTEDNAYHETLKNDSIGFLRAEPAPWRHEEGSSILAEFLIKPSQNEWRFGESNAAESLLRLSQGQMLSFVHAQSPTKQKHANVLPVGFIAALNDFKQCATQNNIALELATPNPSTQIAQFKRKTPNSAITQAHNLRHWANQASSQGKSLQVNIKTQGNEPPNALRTVAKSVAKQIRVQLNALGMANQNLSFHTIGRHFPSQTQTQVEYALIDTQKNSLEDLID